MVGWHYSGVFTYVISRGGGGGGVDLPREGPTYSVLLALYKGTAKPGGGDCGNLVKKQKMLFHVFF